MKATYVGFLGALLLSLSSTTALADEELGFDELPAPVQETVAREVRGGHILEIEREEDDGVIVYEVEFALDGVKYELDVAPDGTLLRRHRD